MPPLVAPRGDPCDRPFSHLSTFKRRLRSRKVTEKNVFTLYGYSVYIYRHLLTRTALTLTICTDHIMSTVDYDGKAFGEQHFDSDKGATISPDEAAQVAKRKEVANVSLCPASFFRRPS